MATETSEQDFLERFRNYVRRGGKTVTVMDNSPFFERIRQDPSARLEPGDFMSAHHGGQWPSECIARIHEYSRFSHWPWDRYYLSGVVICGSPDTQVVTYYVYEKVFAGPFALYRMPQLRRRELTVPVSDFAADYATAASAWKRGIDQEVEGEDVFYYGYRATAKEVEVYMHRMGI